MDILMFMVMLEVLLPLPFHKTFSYSYEGNDVSIGQFVDVSFRNKIYKAVIWGIQEKIDEKLSYKLKAISQIYPFPPLSERMIEFIEWMSKYTLTPKGQILKMTLSCPQAFQIPQIKYVERKEAANDLRSTKTREKIFAEFTNQPVLPLKHFSEQEDLSYATVKTLIQKNALELHEKPSPIDYAAIQKFSFKPSTLRDDQSNAVQEWRDYGYDNHHVTLLDGMTGSGKTEVYFEMINDCLQKGKQILILLPEIALTAQWMKRFEERFGAKPDLWHSDLSASYRGKVWRHCVFGECKIIVGARSALFLPMYHLGLIIIDEEHDQSYKQEEQAIYNARDMAIARARLESIPVLLASATPSLETIANVESGKYNHIHLTQRHGQAQLPDIYLLNLKEHPPKKEPQQKNWISEVLLQKIAERLERNEQILLFLNRRGYAPLYLCSSCGHRFECPDCSASLVEHKSSHLLRCHHCDYQIYMPKECPKCGGTDFASCGPGVERIAEEIQREFPQNHVFLATSDHLNSAQKANDFVQMVTDKKVDILIGTQILAKGYHFPDLTLVCVLDADIGLDGGDLRAAEKSFQLLNQVSGRAGRSVKKGEVYLQTWNDIHPVMQALVSQNRNGFYKLELQERCLLSMPPYGRLVAFIISSKNQDEAYKYAKQFAKAFPQIEQCKLFGPAPAPLFQLRNQYRYRLLLKTPKKILPQKYIQQFMNEFDLPKHVKCQIDIDPQSFM